MELISISWNAFIETGDIDAYLLYKSISEKEQEADGKRWEPSENKVL